MQSEHVVAQHCDVLGRGLLELRYQVNIVAVELVIARHIDDGAGGEVTSRPAHALHANTDVAGKNCRVAIRVGWPEFGEFDMQVSQNVEWRERFLGELRDASYCVEGTLARQDSMSMVNTRLRRCAQVIAHCLPVADASAHSLAAAAHRKPRDRVA